MVGKQHNILPWQRKKHFLQHKGNHGNFEEVCTDRRRRKGGFAAVFTDTTRRGALPQEASIHTADMTAIKIVMKEFNDHHTNRAS